jgi:hypothetical protein
MGIQIISGILPDLGLDIANCIMTFEGKCSVVKMGVNQYKLSSSYTVKKPNSKSFFISPLTLDIAEEDLNGNLLGLLYGKLKEQYPDCVDN